MTENVNKGGATRPTRRTIAVGCDFETRLSPKERLPLEHPGGVNISTGSNRVGTAYFSLMKPYLISRKSSSRTSPIPGA